MLKLTPVVSTLARASTLQSVVLVAALGTLRDANAVDSVMFVACASFVADIASNDARMRETLDRRCGPKSVICDAINEAIKREAGILGEGYKLAGSAATYFSHLRSAVAAGVALGPEPGQFWMPSELKKLTAARKGKPVADFTRPVAALAKMHDDDASHEGCLLADPVDWAVVAKMAIEAIGASAVRNLIEAQRTVEPEIEPVALAA